MRVVHEASNLVVKGHNNRIKIEKSVASILLAGHNNKLFGVGQGAFVQNLTVTGHNNRIENLQLGNVVVSGHNNCLKNLTSSTLTDTGMNNKLTSCHVHVSTRSHTQSTGGGDGAPRNYYDGQYEYESEESEGGYEEDTPEYTNVHQSFFPPGFPPNAMPSMPGMPDLSGMTNMMGNINSMFNNIQTHHPFPNMGSGFGGFDFSAGFPQPFAHMAGS